MKTNIPNNPLKPCKDCGEVPYCWRGHLKEHLIACKCAKPRPVFIADPPKCGHSVSAWKLIDAIEAWNKDFGKEN